MGGTYVLEVELLAVSDGGISLVTNILTVAGAAFHCTGGLGVLISASYCNLRSLRTGQSCLSPVRINAGWPAWTFRWCQEKLAWPLRDKFGMDI